MSEAIYIPLAIQAADDGFKAMQAVFDDAKNRHDSAKLAAADRAQLMMLMVQIAGYLKTQTNWIMSISQPEQAQSIPFEDNLHPSMDD